MMRRLRVVCLVVTCVIASWVWYATRPSQWLGRMLDLPRSMHVHNSWIKGSLLFHYTDAYCDIPCSESEFQAWQASIHGRSSTFSEVPFLTQGLPPTLQEWWIRGPIHDPPMFQARRDGATVLAVWHQGKAFVAFYQGGKLGGPWEIKPQ